MVGESKSDQLYIPNIPILAKKPEFLYQKDGEEQDAHYSPNVVNKYSFNLLLNMFILVAIITSRVVKLQFNYS